MPAILHDHQHWLSQPPRSRLSVDWRHPLTRALAFAVAPASQYGGPLVDLVHGRRASAVGTWVVRPGGPAVADAQFSAADTAADLAFASGAWAVAVYYRLDAVPANGEYPNIIGRATYVSEANNQGWGLQVRAPDAPSPGFATFSFRNNGAGSYVLRAADPTAAVGDHIMFTTSSGSLRRIWNLVEGNNTLTQANTSNNASPLTTSAVLSIGNALTTGKLYVYLAVAWQLDFTGIIVASEFNPYANEFCMNPWGMFVEDTPISYFLPERSDAQPATEPEPELPPVVTADLLLATVDVDDFDTEFYHGRIVGHPTVTRGLADSFLGPVRHEDVTVVIANRDGALTDLWQDNNGWRRAALETEAYDRISGDRRVNWTGVIAESDHDARAGTITVRGTNLDLGAIDQPVPRGVVSADEFALCVDTGATKPVFFGTVRKMQVPYINEDLPNSIFDYMARWGEDVTVTAVFRGTGTTAAGTPATELVDPSEYTVSTTDWPGYTTIRFALRQVNFSNGFYPIYITATQLTGDDTERNPIRVIRHILEDEDWGCDQVINTALFDAAEAALDAAGPYFVDGAMLSPAPAREWLAELCMFRGIRLGVDTSGQWYPILDAEQVVVAASYRDGTGDGERNLLEPPVRSFANITETVRDLKLSYRERLTNPGTFRQKEALSREVNTARGVDSVRYGADRVLTNRFIWEHETADRVVDFQADRLRRDLQRVTFVAGQAGRAREPAEVVSLTCAYAGFDAELLEIVQVTEDFDRAQIVARPWAAYVYAPSTLPDAPPDPSNQNPANDTPTAATNLQECANVNAGATASVTICYDIIDTHTDPALVFVTVWLQYRRAAESAWTTASSSGFGGFAIEQTATGLDLDADYVFRCVTLNSAANEAPSEELAVHTTT